MKVRDFMHSCWQAFYSVIHILALTAFIIAFSIITFWIWYPYDPLTVDYIKICNPGKRVLAGDTLLYEISYNKKMNVTGTLSRKLINDTKIELADADATAPIGRDCDKVRVKIPGYADAGIYTLYWHVDYKVNPIRTITVAIESEKFEVTR
jgi:hypothetical protein